MVFEKQGIIRALEDVLGDNVSSDKLYECLQKVKDGSKGDLAFVCHPLAKILKKSPNVIAQELANELNSRGLIGASEISSIEPLNGYINFRYNYETFSTRVLEEIISSGDDYGRNNLGNGKLIVIDFSAPNLGKPMHVGHIRSTILGDSMIKLWKFSGYRTYGINYLGDIGLHTGKLITAYNRWGNREKLESNPEREMFELYVRYGREVEGDASLKDEAKEVIRKIEAGDPTELELFSKIREWSLSTFQRVYDLLHVKFDEITGQSLFSDKGKAIVKKSLDTGLAQYGKGPVRIQWKKGDTEQDSEEEEGCGVFIDLSEYKLHSKVILRSDGTALYSTQDLGAAVDRYEKHRFDRMVYAVATEQSLYFKQIFKILDLMGYDFAKDCYHLGFGLIHFSEGRMSTREGKVVLLEDLLGKSVDLARKILEDRNMPNDLKDDIARQVGIGAIKYMVLQVEPVKDIVFSWDRALDFSGNSGPYIQYSYARASRVIEKRKINSLEYRGSDFRQRCEIDLLKKLDEFPETVVLATNEYKPNLIANYLNELSSGFNDFYENVKVIGTNEESSRLALIEATRTVMRNASALLGIELPLQM